MIDFYKQILPFIEKLVGNDKARTRSAGPLARQPKTGPGGAPAARARPVPSAETFGEAQSADKTPSSAPAPVAAESRPAPHAVAVTNDALRGTRHESADVLAEHPVPAPSALASTGPATPAVIQPEHVGVELSVDATVTAVRATAASQSPPSAPAAQTFSAQAGHQVPPKILNVVRNTAPQPEPASATVAPSAKTAQAPAWQLSAGRATHDDPLLGCLSILARMTHQPFSPDALIAGLPLADNRLTPALFVRAAARAGLAARVVKRPLDKISALVLPAVLLLADGQACVLEKIHEDGSMRIVQPESGHGAISQDLEQIAALYTGFAIFVKPSYRFDERSASSAIPRPDHWFWDTLKESWLIYSEVLLASLLINFFALASPLFIMNVYDRVVPNNAVETLWVLAIGIAIVFGFDWLIRTLRGYFIDVASKRTDIMLSAMLFERVLGIRMSARPASVGAFANNLQEFESLRDFFTSTTLTALVDLPFTLLFILIIWMIGGPLAWVPLAIIPLAVLVGFLIQIPLGKTVEQLFRHSTQKHATLIECLTGLETIKSAGAEGTRQRLWEQAIGNIAKLGLKVRLLSATAANTTAFLQQFATVVVVIAGVYLIADGKLTTGALIACTLLTGRALAPLTQVAATLTRYHQARASLKTISRLMELPLERPAGKSFLHRPVMRGEIELRNVVFNYPGQQVAALKGVSFRIRAGEHVAIIGRIGSGKSTVEKLVLGLYEPDSGSVLIDGTDIRQLDPADIRHNIGYVPQDITLFYGSVRDNIVFGAPYADDATMQHAAEIAGVSDFVGGDPAGFDRQVGERGEGLSGGQRQSVAVARALLMNRPILLMDEPSNAMDNRSEEILKGRMSEYLAGKTLLLVTHRASLLSLVSRIIVMDGGNVVADGPKDDVMEALKHGKIKVSQ